MTTNAVLRTSFLMSAGAAVLSLLLALSLAAAPPDPARTGRDFFEKRCTGCHNLDTLKAGPPLRAVFGRRAGADPQFPYSKALKQSQLTWTEAALDRWLTDPDALVPGNDMTFRLDNTAERSAIIAYLKQLTAPQSAPSR